MSTSADMQQGCHSGSSVLPCRQTDKGTRGIKKLCPSPLENTNPPERVKMKSPNTSEGETHACSLNPSCWASRKSVEDIWCIRPKLRSLHSDNTGSLNACTVRSRVPPPRVVCCWFEQRVLIAIGSQRCEKYTNPPFSRNSNRGSCKSTLS
eukprot:8562822-Pyramimonas_sp.AAC.1